uniref:Lymphocyte antigen 96 n=1 Tax=Laticauda laticaudata TaxID=8630 RepID=A0A8C5S139_LATLA
MVLRYLHFFQLVIILSVYGFTVALEKQLLCTSNDIDILYSYCGSGRDNFLFSVEPCWLRDRTKWQGTIFWIPKADLTVVNARIQLWNGPFKSLKWESTICYGVDDDYSYCGALKGGKYEYSVFNRPMKFVLILVLY